MAAVRMFTLFFCMVGIVACARSDALLFPYEAVDMHGEPWPRLVAVQALPAQPEDAPRVITADQDAIITVGTDLRATAEAIRQPVIDSQTRAFMQRALDRAGQ